MGRRPDQRSGSPLVFCAQHWVWGISGEHPVYVKGSPTPLPWRQCPQSCPCTAWKTEPLRSSSWCRWLSPTQPSACFLKRDAWSFWSLRIQLGQLGATGFSMGRDHPSKQKTSLQHYPLLPGSWHTGNSRRAITRQQSVIWADGRLCLCTEWHVIQRGVI